MWKMQSVCDGVQFYLALVAGAGVEEERASKKLGFLVTSTTKYLPLCSITTVPITVRTCGNLEILNSIADSA